MSYIISIQFPVLLGIVEKQNTTSYRFYYLDISKIKNNLEWKPKIDIKDGLESVWK